MDKEIEAIRAFRQDILDKLARCTPENDKIAQTLGSIAGSIGPFADFCEAKLKAMHFDEKKIAAAVSLGQSEPCDLPCAVEIPEQGKAYIFRAFAIHKSVTDLLAHA